MASLAEVFVAVRPETAGFESDLKRKLARVDAKSEGGRVGQGFGDGFLGSFKGVAAGIGTAFAAVGVVNLFGSFISEAREAGAVTRITENAIRSTGGAARVTADDVGALAESISNKTGIDDETVQSSANLLLTFKAVRDEVGAGNDVFSRATALTQDLAAAGFGSADSAAKMLGKALNDPIAGLTALGRAGVTFTEQQKAQIRTLVETGDVLGAQRIILDEVASQVGGAAAAAADPMQRLGVIVANLKERVGTALLPVIEAAATWLGTHLPGALATATAWFSRLGDIVRPVFEWIATDGVGGVRALVTAFQTGQTNSTGFAGVMERIGVVARQVFDYFRDTVLPVLANVARFVQDNSTFFLTLVGTVGALVAALRVWAVVQAALNLVLAANPIGLVVVAIGALVAGLVVAYQRSETFRNIVQAAWQGIQVAVSFAWERVIQPALAALERFLTGTLAPAVTGLWRNVIEPAFRGVSAAVTTAWGIVRPILELAEAVFRTVVGPAITRFWQNTVAPAMRGFGQAVTDAWNVVRPIFETLGSFIANNVAPAFRTGVTAIGAAWEAIKEKAKAPVRFVVDTVINNGIIDNFNKVAKFFGTSEIARLSLPRGWATGGYTGPGPVTKIAGVVHARETVINADSTSKMERFAPGLLSYINRKGRLPGYQTGGRVADLIPGRGWRITGDPNWYTFDQMRTLTQGWTEHNDTLVEPAHVARRRRLPGGLDPDRDGADGLGDIWDAVSGFLTDPLGGLRRAVEGLIGGIGDSGLAAMLKGVPAKLLSAAAAKIGELFGGGGGDAGGVGKGVGGRGWAWQMKFLRSVEPLVQLISGYRVSRTRSGAVSWHTRDGGRAVDVSPIQSLAAKIRASFGGDTLELITPWANLNLLRGAPHRYSDAVMGDHDGRTNVRHIHWAYDQGGWLQPGTTVAQNNTGQAERILGPHDTISLTPATIERLAAAFVQGVQSNNGRLALAARAGLRT